MTSLSPVKGENFAFARAVGAGGIGSGMLFRLTDNRTLGREESRPGILSKGADYCKLHIIFHYLSVLLGAGPKGMFRVYPVGKVGGDETGRRLLTEMRDAGMNLGYVTTQKDSVTLFSVCFLYPDGSGGNITTANSACAEVSPEDIDGFFRAFPGDGERELIVAVPEVPLKTRLRLLEMGKQRGGFTAASVLASEASEFEKLGGYALTDLLSVNMDEAREIAAAGKADAEGGPVVDKCVRKLSAYNPRMILAVTDGVRGNYGYKDGCCTWMPVCDVETVSTAGAGDAFLAGVLAGLSCGLPFLKNASDSTFAQSPLACALELGTLLAAVSVMSQDTIHRTADAGLLYETGRNRGKGFSEDMARCFRNVH